MPAVRAARFGRIIIMPSRAIPGKSERVVYAGAKAGLIGMTRMAAIAVRADGITVSAVLPGPIATAHVNPDGCHRGSLNRRTIAAQVRVKRLGTPPDVADAVCFRVGARRGCITGRPLWGCGGASVTGSGGE